MMPNQADKDDTDEDDGKSDSGGFGRPQLKPNLDNLLGGAIPGDTTEPGFDDLSESFSPPEQFGAWELHEKSLMLYHRQLKKKLLLSQLDVPSKMMKVIIALSTQPNSAGCWEIENLVKAMDYATTQKFGKGLYQIAGLSSDHAKLDWTQGKLTANAEIKNAAYHHQI
jgi:hypothetical protein